MPFVSKGEGVACHSRFFFHDGTVVFSVEDVLFKVHRYFFIRDSEVFKAMFSLPVPPDEQPEGGSTHDPIVLEGVRRQDFEHFLSILYPSNFLKCDIRTVDEWTSVLSVASTWEFASVRQLAIKRLSEITSPVDKINLGLRYDIVQWLVPAYVEVCERDEPLNQEEGKKLGMEDVIAIGEVRHSIRYLPNLNRHHDAVVDLVKNIFGI